MSTLFQTHFTNESSVRFNGHKTYHTIHPQNAARADSDVLIRETILKPWDS